jgi:hypothetical protein
MTKFVLNVRHRPTMEETIEQHFAHFVSIVNSLPPPWGLVEGKELKLPPIGTGLSTSAMLRGKLGVGISGVMTISYRAPANFRDQASHDDSVVIEFDSSKATWEQVVDDGLPGYVRANGAYTGRLERWDEMPETWEVSSEICRRLGKDLDGRDGFFRFGPVSYMDRELCRRGCDGMTPEQIVAKLTGVVPEVRLLNDGVLIVAADHFPEQAEIIATDRVIRERLDLPLWV